MPDPQRYEFWIPGPPAAKGSMSGFPMPVTRDIEPARDFYSTEIDYLRDMLKWYKGRKFRCVITHDSKATKPWQHQVRMASLERRPVDMAPHEGPVKVGLQFAVPRPKSHITADGLRLRKGAPALPIKHGTKDIDKLTRCILDALTGVFFVDDSQVVEDWNSKRYASTVDLPTEVTHPGVKITLSLE